MATVAENLERVRARIAAAAHRSGRDAAEIVLVAVSKGVDADRIDEAIAAGVEHLGESRIQETQRRLTHLLGQATLHLVGHLQTNKAGAAVELYDLIHSLDSPRLALALQKRAGDAGTEQRVLVEVNTTGEPSKFGVAPAELSGVLDALAGCPNLRLEGLMTIGPLAGSERDTRRSFSRLRELLEVAKRAGVPGADPRHLSMGMTDDFEIAIEEGATLVRIGTAVFGSRGG